jgi:glycosyltransferase involved in cell wall biosynthesis
MGKTLFFLTSKFPFGNGETFIENEIEFLCDAFDKIILISDDYYSADVRDVPSNIELLRYDSRKRNIDKIASLKIFLKKQFWSELNICKKKYDLKINSSIIKTMINSLYLAQNKTKLLNKLITKELSTNNEVFLYSYWCNENAISLVLVKTKYPFIRAYSRAHGYDIYFDRHYPPYLPYRNLIFSNLDSVLFISQNGLNYTTEKLKYQNQENFTISRLGIKEGFINKHNSSETTCHLLSCSNVIKLKRINLIVDALNNLKITDKIKWTHIGGGELLNETIEYAKKTLSKKRNIDFEFLGHQNYSCIFEFYRNNDIKLFINVSKFEGIPVSIMEAFSFAIPALATDVGGNSEIVDHKQNGIIISPNPDANEIANAIEEIYLMEKKEYYKLSNNAYITWKEKYNAKKNYLQFVDVILA